MIALLVIALLAQSPHDHHTRVNLRAGNRKASVGLAFFEAFNSRGMGTFGACSTTAPTGARGETLTFARTSSATCTKTATGGLATTGIANGDLVLLSSGQPRVEYDSNGVLGLLVESSRTNSILRSQELDNASWTTLASGVAVPTVTADAAVAPDGTTTADRIQVPATTGVNYSIIRQSGACAASTTDSASVYVKGVSGSGSLQICLYPVAATWNCTPCSYVSTSWSRCMVPNKSLGAGTYYALGSNADGANPASAADAYVWGMDCEAGAYATSYIPTTSATVTRAADQGYFTVASTEVQSLAASVNTSGGFNGNARPLGAWKDANNVMELYIPGPGATPLHTLQTIATVSKDLAAATNVPTNSTSRLVGWVIPSTTIGAVVNGTETTNSSSVQGALTGVTRIYVGKYHASTGFEIDGIVSRVCVDSSPTRCR